MEQSNDNKNLYEYETFNRKKNNNMREYGILMIFLLIIAGMISICWINFDSIVEFFDEVIEDYDDNSDLDDYYESEDNYEYDGIDECNDCYIEQGNITEDDMKIAELFFDDYLGSIDNYRIIMAKYSDGWFMMEYITYVYEDGTYDSVYAETYDFHDYKVTKLNDQDKNLEESVYTIYNIKEAETEQKIYSLATQYKYLIEEVTMTDIENLLSYLLSIDLGEFTTLYNSKKYVVTTKTHSNYSIEYKFADPNNANNTITLRCSDDCVKNWKIYGVSNVNSFGESKNVSFDGTYYYLNYSITLDDSQYLKAKEFVGNKYD